MITYQFVKKIIYSLEVKKNQALVVKKKMAKWEE